MSAVYLVCFDCEQNQAFSWNVISSNLFQEYSYFNVLCWVNGRSDKVCLSWLNICVFALSQLIILKVWDKNLHTSCYFLHSTSRRSCFYLSMLLFFSISVASIKVWHEFFIHMAWWWLASDEKQFPLHKYPSSLMLSDSKCDIQGIHVTLWVTDNVI